MLIISKNVSIPLNEIELTAIRSQGKGGQNVNKVSSAIHLFFNIHNSSLPIFYKNRLLKLNDKRITNDGIIIIKAQSYRTQESNKRDALERLQQIIKSVAQRRKNRIPTNPTKGSKVKRLDSKNKQSQIKKMRKNPNE